MVPPPDETPKSLGDGVTGSDVGPPEDSSAQSLGDQSTTGDLGSSVSDLDALVGEFEDDQGEVIDLEARYELQETLGQGGMGEVVLARDKRLNRQVAIKRLKEELGASQRAKQRFLTEAQSVAKLNHYNIVQIYEYGRAADGPFIVMEYVSGGSLDDRLKDGALELAESVEIIAQVCDGLQKAHDAKIVHRDIKPANVLLTLEGVPKLTDFGLARQETVEGGRTQAGVVLGTLDFMSVEQREDASQADARSDQWSLAATLYQLVTGESPRVIDLGEVPETIRGALQQALKKPEARYESVTAFGQALRDAMSGPVTATTHGLKQGQCPGCEVINDTERKFCKGCGESLREVCLKCEVLIGPWENFCPDCGANLDKLALGRRAELDGIKEKVGDLRRECRFAEASTVAGELSEETHSRLRDYAVWSGQVIEEIAAEKKKRVDERDERIVEARRLVDADELENAVRVIEQVPAVLRNRPLQEMEQMIERRNAELLGRMKALIEEAEEQRRGIEKDHAECLYLAAIDTAKGLASRREPELSEYVPWAEEQLETLRSELAAWEQKRVRWLVEAQLLYESKEYSSAIELLDQLPLSMRSDPVAGSTESSEVRRLLQQSKAGLAEQQERDRLRETFRQSQQQIPKLRGEYRHADAIEILEPLAQVNVQELTSYIEWARQQLVVIRDEYQEIQKTQDRLLFEAIELTAQHDYSEALRLLNQVPEPFRDKQTTALLRISQDKIAAAKLRRTAIKKAWKNKAYDDLNGMVAEHLEWNPRDPGVVRLQEILEERERRRIERKTARREQEQLKKARQLQQQILEARSSETVDPAVLSALLHNYKQLVPDDEEANRLHAFVKSFSWRANLITLLSLGYLASCCAAPLVALLATGESRESAWAELAKITTWCFFAIGGVQAITVVPFCLRCRGFQLAMPERVRVAIVVTVVQLLVVCSIIFSWLRQL
jgi:serine/threonine protein kinase